MSKGILRSTKSYVKNAGIHVWRVITRVESVGDALDGVRKDTSKLRGAASRHERPSRADQSEAKRLLNEGRQAYNGGDYEKAEKFFRASLIEDKRYAWAMTYLGHSLYKQNRRDDAVEAWNKAVDLAPDSDAAAKARKKLQHVAKQQTRLHRELDERIRDL